MSDAPATRIARIATVSLIVIGALGMASLALFYPVIGSDGWIHLNWLRQFSDLFASGELYPRWMPDSFAGFGSSAFYFYPPLAYWIGGLFSMAGVASEITLYQCVSVFFLVLSAATAYALLRELTSSKRAALIGAAFYCVFPYRFADVYLRNALGEHAAFAFIPIVLLALYHSLTQEYSRKEQLRIVVLSAIGWSGLFLTNVPASFMMIYVTIIFWIVSKSYRKSEYWHVIANVAGIVLALAVAAVCLWPASDLRDAISTDVMGGVNLHIAAAHSTGYAILDSLVDQKLKTLYALLDVVLLCGVAIVWAKRSEVKNSHDRFARAIVIVTAFAVLVQVPYVSYPIWKILPAMDMLQFTWRWDIWITIAAAIFVTQLVSRQAESNAKYLMIVLAILVTGFAAWKFNVGAKDRELGFAPNADAVMDAPEYLPEIVAADPEKAMRYFAQHTSDAEIKITKGFATIAHIDRQSFSTTFDVIQTSGSTDLLFGRAYFPTWHLKDDRGVEYPVRADSTGRIVATITEGKRTYQLRIVKRNSERVGAWISGFGLLILFGLGVTTVLWRKPKAS